MPFDLRHDGRLVRAYRQSLGWSIAELAERASISEKTQLRVEQNSGDPESRTLNRIGAALGIAPVRFIREDVLKHFLADRLAEPGPDDETPFWGSRTTSGVDLIDSRNQLRAHSVCFRGVAVEHLESAMALGTVPVPGHRHPYPVLVGIVLEEQTPARADSDNTTPKERK